MKWLDRLLGKETNSKPYATTKKAIISYVGTTTGPFNAQDVAKHIGMPTANGRGLHRILHVLEGEGVVKMLPYEMGTKMAWVRADIKTPVRGIVQAQQMRETKAKIKLESKYGKVEPAVLQFINTSKHPVSTPDVQNGLADSFSPHSVRHAIERLYDKGAIRKVGRIMKTGYPLIWEGKNTQTTEPTSEKPKPEVTLPKSIPTPTITSAPITVPFYYDAEFRVVAKRDKRLVTLIEQKRTDAMGNDKWEPAETNVRLYQQALKAVCGHLLPPTGGSK